MNRQEYILRLEGQNAYCRCPNLQGLFANRNIVLNLEARCDALKAQINLDEVQEDDLPRLTTYQRHAEALKLRAKRYYQRIFSLAENGELKIILHDSTKFKPLGKIHYERARDLMDKGNAIVTIHCSDCSQQIEVAV
jgi:hypothetical protein